MKCVVTAGPTYEPLDEVRRLTNFSTGQLGTQLAEWLQARGHQVTLLLGHYATYREDTGTVPVESFSTTTDLQERLQRLAREQVEAVFHAAAVSDFGFGTVWEETAAGEKKPVQGGKLSTRQGRLLAELVPTPKILSRLRDWYGPHALLVGWKYEVDGNPGSVLARAEAQLAECRTTACVVNGPAYGAGFGLMTAPGEVRHFQERPALFAALEILRR